jgi:hypothetical protein
MISVPACREGRKAFPAFLKPNIFLIGVYNSKVFDIIF